MRSMLDTRGDAAFISLAGRFDASTGADFARSCDAALGAKGVQRIEVDLGGVSHSDRSAPDMLLRLTRLAEERNITVVLVNCRGELREALTAANLDALFTMK